MREILSILIILSTLAVSGQEQVLSLENTNFKGGKRNVENYTLVNSKTNEIAIILGQNEKVSSYLYSEDFIKKAEANATHLKRKYKETIGYTVDGSTYTLVFATNNRKKFGFISINISTGKTVTKEIEFKFKNEKYLETINFDNRMVLMSASKDNELTLREFTLENKFKTIATFQLNSEDREQRLVAGNFLDFDLFGSFQNTIGGITKIDTRVPNTIDRTSSENKLYHSGDKIYITFEEEDTHTILNTIDLESLTLKTSFIAYPQGIISDFKNYNSFIYDEKFFHIASSRDEMIFQVKDFDNTVIKEYRVERDDEIAFKNGPIIQDGSLYSRGKRELDETKQFLRKITSGNIGLSIHEENNNLLISLGSYKMIQGGGGGLGTFGGQPAGPIGGTTIPIPNGSPIFVPAYNPTFASYGGYGFSKAVYVNGIFDKDFNHINSEEITDNIFDRIKDYEDELKFNTASDVFIHKNMTYFSYWNTREQRYTLVRF